MQIRKWLLNWLRSVDREELTTIYELMAELSNHDTQQYGINDELIKSIEKFNLQSTLGLYKLELVLKHGCLDCFSVDGEWHKDDCAYAKDADGNKQLVRRHYGRQPAGKC